ncbi:Tir chaperone protein (CesT) family [Trypanosoma melophagium]|uniref:Tir chaperone protein (CesT) family n=1 Tax=Trypanosoma melophagium TaxID=715481 RepID=UPI003519EABF|nr:Tir chaperone protein (CesT) family [Trypanosoma melophagium]
MDDKQIFFVQGTDGRKFKIVIRGDLGKLSVGKIRRCLKSYGVPDGQLLLFNNIVLRDDAVGADFGLCNNAMLHLAVSQDAGVNESWDERGRDEAPVQSMRDHRTSTSPHSTMTDSKDRASHLASLRESGGGLTNHVDPENSFDLRPTVHSNPAENNFSNKVSNSMENTGLNTALEVENLQLREEVQRLRRELTEVREQQKNRGGRGSVGKRQETANTDLLQNAKANLQELGEELGMSLQFDMNLTCVVGTDERHTVLVTFDHATERLYIYSTLLTHLPNDAAVRVKLYELLLEGSLLGREVCGGGIGMSLQNDIVLLSTTIPLRCSSSSALKDIMPVFVETLGRWRSLVNELVE